ncbi:MAG: hypothetical protein H7235_03620 [Bdellovibrionaceae bacterium]|nr:hypothetical protein [Pseudobdellovibrionaceae bacterium]
MQIVNKMRNRFQLTYKKYGWKALAGVLAYYLVRDLTLYVFIPYVAFSK